MIRAARLDDVTLHWREDGDPDGLPVVFANSLGTDLRIWDAVIPLLPAGYRFIRFDNRGHGLSSVTPPPADIAAFTGDAEALMDRLGIASAVFVGLSIGGQMGMALAARRPELVRALVLSNSAVKLGTPEMWRERIAGVGAGGIAAMSQGIVEKWFSRAFLETEAATAWRHLLERTPLEGYLACMHALMTADLTETARGLRLPVLGIGGAEDGACPPDLAEETTAMFAGSRHVTIGGAGHLPPVEQPEVYAGHLARFLAELDGPR